jgi:hypothetical protein
MVQIVARIERQRNPGRDCGLNRSWLVMRGLDPRIHAGQSLAKSAPGMLCVPERCMDSRVEARQ